MANSPGMPTYAKLLPTGAYEYGRIEYAPDRRRDRMVPIGIAPSYESAVAALAAAPAAEVA